jgi:hypothetical protein
MGIITAAVKGTQLRLPEVWNSPWLGLVIFFILGFILIYFPYKKMVSSGEVGSPTEGEES